MLFNVAAPLGMRCAQPARPSPPAPPTRPRPSPQPTVCSQVTSRTNLSSFNSTAYQFVCLPATTRVPAVLGVLTNDDP